MKKLTLIFIIILVFQSSFSVSASERKGIFDFLKTNKSDISIKEKNIDKFYEQEIRKIDANIPDLSFSPVNFDDDATDSMLIKYCRNDRPEPLFIFPRNSTYPLYRVEWGDGDIFEGTYSQLINSGHIYKTGEYSLIYSVFFNNVWYNSEPYIVFAGQPTKLRVDYKVVSELCVGDSIVFHFSGKMKGTKYDIVFSDDAKKLEFDYETLPDSIVHYFKDNSCGKKFKTSDKEYQNAFGLTVVSINPCDKIPDVAGPFYVSSEPQPDMTIPIRSCVNQEIIIQENSSEATTPYPGQVDCTTGFKKLWKVFTTSNNYELINSQLGTEFPQDSNKVFSSGSNSLNIKFKKAGVYTLKLLMANNCFSKAIYRTIIIEPIIEPKFNYQIIKDSCENFKVRFQNVTQINLNDFEKHNPPVFKWTVTPAGNYFVGGTNASSANPEFHFKVKNTYTVTLTYTGTSCDDVSVSKSFVVNGVPTVNINPMHACLKGDSVSVNDTATINTFGLKVDKYLWKITDESGFVLYTDTIEKPVFKFFKFGRYIAYLDVTTTCGTNSAHTSFLIEPEPTIEKVNDFIVCEREDIPPVPFVVKHASKGIRWVNTNTSIGLAASGTSTKGNEQLPSFKALNPGVTPITATITVYPLNSGCEGNPISFTITVNPSKDTAPHKKYVYCNGEVLSDLKVLYNNVEANTNATYQWYRYRRGEAGVPILNETSASLKPINIVDTTYYYCEITGCGGAVIKSNPDTVIIHPAAIISDYSRLCKSGIPANFTPINGIDGSIPHGTTYIWTIDFANSDSRIIGASGKVNPVNEIIDTLSLSEGFNEPFAIVRYIVTAQTGECKKTFTIFVKVIPNITADIKVNPINCYGGTGSIDISNIVGVIGANTQIELWKNQIKESEVIISDTKYNFPGLLKGNYKIIILDKDNYLPGGEFVYDNLILNEPDQIAISSNIKNVTCSGAKDGSINVTVTGGTLNGGNSYKYKWEQNTGTGWQIYTDYVNWKSITGLVRGFYRLTVTDDNNCLEQKDFFVSEPNPLNFDHVSFSIEDCDGVLNPSGKILVSNPRGGTVLYTNNYQFKFRYNNVETNYMNINEINSKLSNIQEGKYFVTLKDDNNCEFTKEIIVNRIPPLVAFINSDIVYDCGNTISRKYTVTVGGGVPEYSVKWFAGNNEIGSGFTFTPPKEYNGINITVKVTDQRNCIYTLVLDAFQADVPIFDWYYKKKLGCNEYEFIAQISDVIGSNYEFIWDFGGGEEKTKSMSITRNLDGYPVNSATGNFEVSLKILRFGCAYPVNVKTIPQNSVPNIELTQNGASEVNDVYWFCKGDTITVTATGASSYSWSTNSKSNSIRIYDEGIYTVWGLNGIGCLSKRTFETKFYNQPFSIIATPQEIELGETIKFSVEPIIPFTQEYKWNFGDGTTGSSSESFIEHLYKTFMQDYFNVQVKVITREGCTEEASTSVKVNIENIPNTIIPEGSMESNRIFMPGCRVQIYNRNGVLIHQGDNGWDGKYNGKIVASDTYFYILTYSSKGKLQTRQGYITVLR